MAEESNLPAIPARPFRLYQIPQEFQQIEEEIIEGGGEVTPELEARIQSVMAQGLDKVEAACHVLMGMELAAAAYTTELDRLTKDREALRKAHERLKGLIRTAVDAMGGKAPTPHYPKLATRKNPESWTVYCTVTPQALHELAPELVKVDYELNRSKILEAFQAGAALPEEVTVTPNPVTRHLRMK